MATTNLKRKPHTKVRTGCLTCKTRRKKCDEAKPFCRRCVNAGYKCDGYADITIVRAHVTETHDQPVLPSVPHTLPKTLDISSDSCSNQSSPWRDEAPTPAAWQIHDIPATSVMVSENEPEESTYSDFSCEVVRLNHHHHQSQTLNVASPIRYHPSVPRSPNTFPEIEQISDLELHCYSYVRLCTLPRLSAYYSNWIWHFGLQRIDLATRYPALFKAVTALGAVHRRFCYGISREAFEYCAHAERLYKNAVRALDKLKKSTSLGMSRDDVNVIMTCEIILGMFQGFQGDSVASSTHVRAGILAAFPAPSRMIHSQSFRYAKPSPPRIICDMLYRLYCRACELFGEPPITYDIRHMDARPRAIPAPKFNSLVGMKTHLFAIIEGTWQYFRWMEDPSARRAFLKPVEGHLLDWTLASLQALESGLVIEPGQVKAFNLLNMVSCVLSLTVQGNLLKTDRHEIIRIPHLPIFEAPGDDDLSEAAAALCGAIDYMYTIEDSDLSHVRSLFMQTLTTHNIFSFDRISTTESCDTRVPQILGLWTIARQIDQIQEDTIIEKITEVVPQDAIYVDIGDLWHDDRKIMVRYYVPNEDGLGFRWVSEFWLY